MPEQPPKKMLNAGLALKQFQSPPTTAGNPAVKQPALDPWGKPDIDLDAILKPQDTGANLVMKQPETGNILEQTDPGNLTKQPDNLVEQRPTDLSPEMKAEGQKADLLRQKAEYQDMNPFQKMGPDFKKSWQSTKAGINKTTGDILTTLGGVGLNRMKEDGSFLSKEEGEKRAAEGSTVRMFIDNAVRDKANANKIYGEGGPGSWGPMLGGIVAAGVAGFATGGGTWSFIPGLIAEGTTAGMAADIYGNTLMDQEDYAKEHNQVLDPVKSHAIATGSALTMYAAGKIVGSTTKFAGKVFGNVVGTLIKESDAPVINMMREYIANNPETVTKVLKHIGITTGKEVIKSGATMGGMGAVNDLLANIYKDPKDRMTFNAIVKDTWNKTKGGAMMGLILGPFAEGQTAMYNHMRRSEQGINIVQDSKGAVYERVGVDPKNSKNIIVIDKDLNTKSVPLTDIVDHFSMTAKEKAEYLDAWKNNRDQMPAIETSIRQNAIKRHANQLAKDMAFKRPSSGKPGPDGVNPAEGNTESIMQYTDADGKTMYVTGVNAAGDAELISLSPRPDGTFDKQGFTMKNIDMSRIKEIPVQDYANMIEHYYTDEQPATGSASPELPGAAPEPPVPQTPEEVINVYGEKLKFDKGPLSEDINPQIVFGQNKVTGKIVFVQKPTTIGGKVIHPTYDVEELKANGFDFTKVRPVMMSEADIADQKPVPYEQWLSDEVNNYNVTKSQGENMVAAEQSPYKPGQTIEYNGQPYQIEENNGDHLIVSGKEGFQRIEAADYNNIVSDQPAAGVNPGEVRGGQPADNQPGQSGQEITGATEQQGSATPEQPVDQAMRGNIGGQEVIYKAQADGSYHIQISEPDKGEKILKKIAAEVDTDQFEVVPVTEEVPLENATPFARIKTKQVITGINIVPKNNVAQTDVAAGVSAPVDANASQANAAGSGIAPEVATSDTPLADKAQASIDEKTANPDTPLANKVKGLEEKPVTPEVPITEKGTPTEDQPVTEQPATSASDETATAKTDEQTSDSQSVVETDPSKMTLSEFAKWYAENGTDPQTRFRSQRNPDGNDGFVMAAWREATGQKGEELQQAVDNTNKDHVSVTAANDQVDSKPSPAQIKAGNAKKGHANVQGLDITIENAPFTVRKSKPGAAKSWASLMHNPYGYIRRTKGKDGDQIDVFLGNDLESKKVFVVDQIDPSTGKFDEHKAMVGFETKEEAAEAYHLNYEPNWKGLGDITEMSMDEFKKWAGDGTRTQKPAGNVVKADETTSFAFSADEHQDQRWEVDTANTMAEKVEALQKLTDPILDGRSTTSQTYPTEQHILEERIRLNPTDLDGIHDLQNAIKGGGFSAMHVGGKIYLVASRIPNGAFATQKIMHELLHDGINKLDKGILIDLYDKLGEQVIKSVIGQRYFDHYSNRSPEFKKVMFAAEFLTHIAQIPAEDVSFVAKFVKGEDISEEIKASTPSQLSDQLKNYVTQLIIEAYGHTETGTRRTIQSYSYGDGKKIPEGTGIQSGGSGSNDGDGILSTGSHPGTEGESGSTLQEEQGAGRRVTDLLKDLPPHESEAIQRAIDAEGSLYSLDEAGQRRIATFGADLAPVSAISFSMKDPTWDSPDYKDTAFGTVNNRLSKEVEVYERLFGTLDKTMQVPGKLEGSKRPDTRSATPQDIMAAIYDQVQNNRAYLNKLIDPNYPLADLIKERGIKPKEVANFTQDANALRSGAVLSDNGKAGSSVDFLLATCHPTAPCAECYAAAAYIRMSNVRKHFRTTLLMLADPKEFGKRIADEVASIPREKMPFIRLQGSGDLTLTEQVDAYNELSRLADRPIQIFSRHHEMLAQLKSSQNAPFIKMGSIDAKLYETYGEDFLVNNLKERGIANAWLLTDQSEIPAIQSLYDKGALSLVLAADPALHEHLPQGLKDSGCPCDANERTYFGSCRRCAMSNLGCFMAFSDKGVDSKGNFWHLSDPNAPSDITPITEFADPGKTKGNIAIDIAQKSKDLVGLYVRAFKKGERSYVPLKDLRFDKEGGNDFLYRSSSIKEINAYIGNLDYIIKRAKEGTFALPGGPMQPTEVYKDGSAIEGPAADELLNKTVPSSDSKISFSMDPAMTAEEYLTDVRYTPQFRKWFGDSKVINPDGSPMKVYHGTNADFGTFSKGMFGYHFGTLEQATDIVAKKRTKPNGDVAWSGDDGSFDSGSSIMPMYLRIENPIRMSDPGNNDADLIISDLLYNKKITHDEALKLEEISEAGKHTEPWGGAREGHEEDYDVANARGIKAIIDLLKSKGFDGAVYRNTVEGIRNGIKDSYIAFDANQIKSATGNNGGFDPKNDDVNFSLDNKPVVDQLKAKFDNISDKELGVKFKRDGESYFVNSNYAGTECTGFASSIFQMMPDRAKVFGFETEKNPEASHFEETGEYGHDFAVIDDRYIVDPWIKDVEAATDQAVFDMQNPDDAEAIKQFYGDRSKWERMDKVEANALKNLGKNKNAPQFSFDEPVKTDTPAFKEWFGKSTIVDENGKPKVMYHGTRRDFDAFKTGPITPIFLTDDPKFADVFAGMKEDDPLGEGGSIMPLYVRAENPWDYLNPDHVSALVTKIHRDFNVPFSEIHVPYFSNGKWETVEQQQELIREMGFDGFYVQEYDDGRRRRNLAVFTPNQVKSATGNDGSFSKQNDNINFDLAENPATPEFKKWFGDSVLKDESGKPLTFYTGTSKDVIFDKFKMKPNGVWFTSSPKIASMYAGENDSKGVRLNTDKWPYKYEDTNSKDRVIPVWIKAENPFRADGFPDRLKYAQNYKKEQGIWFDQLRREGYDSVILKDEASDSDTVVILKDPSQAKSIYNPKPDAESPKFSFDPDLTAEEYLMDPKYSPNFKKWFGNSKIVDENGKPKVVFHGTPNGKFTEFNYGHRGTGADINSYGDYGRGFYFTPSRETAEAYANGIAERDGKNKPHVIDAYLKIENPLNLELLSDYNKLLNEKATGKGYLNITEQDYEDVYSKLGTNREEIEKLQDVEGSLQDNWYDVDIEKYGYDGVINYDGSELVVFNPNQIKSASGNNGGFDGGNNDINFDLLPHAGDVYKDKGETERSLKEVLVKVREAMQDFNLPLKKFEKEVRRIGGKQADNAKPYRDMSLAFGRQQHLFEDKFYNEKMQPVFRSIADIIKGGMDGNFILPYVIAKHAPELNAAFRAEAMDDFMNHKSDNDPTLAEILAFENSLKNKDYSGILPLAEQGMYDDPDKLANDIVDEFEYQVERKLIDDLWDNIKVASSATLDTWVAAQRLSKDQRQMYHDKFKYFVPLRGWRDGAAKSLVYTKGSGVKKGSSLKQKKGRSSLADNPLAYMVSVESQAIAERVDNEVKTAMLNLIKNNLGNNEIHSMATIKKLYYVKVQLPDGTHEWQPTIDRPDEALFKAGDVATSLYNEHQKLRSQKDALANEVVVKRDSGDVVIVFKDPYLSVAQVMNNQNFMYHSIFGGPPKDARDTNKVWAAMGRWNNFMKGTMTSWNIVFPFTNLSRDAQEASISYWIEGGKGGRMLYNYRHSFPAIARHIMGKTDTNNATDNLLKRFYLVGGATGFTKTHTVEEIEKNIDKEIARMVAEGTLKGQITAKVRSAVGAVTYWNMLFEDATRFAVFLTSIQAGKTDADAGIDAKEASVNFNTKGKLSKSFDSIYAFFNVSAQSLVKNTRLGRDYPLRFAAVAASFLMMGFFESLFNDATNDGNPDDDYYNNSPYMRHNYLMLPNIPAIIQGKPKGDRVLTIPLSQFWRAFKSAGSIFYDVWSGRTTAGDGIKEGMMNFISSLTPVDMGGFYKKGEFSIAPLIPTIGKPIYEAAVNKNYMGYNIYRSPFSPDQAKTLASSGLGATNVSPAAKFFTDMLFRWAGGDSNQKHYTDKNGMDAKVPWIADWNPSVIEHIIKGYSGGTGTVFMDALTTATQGFSKDQVIDFKNIPFVNKFLRQVPKAKWNIIKDFYEMRDDVTVHKGLVSAYNKQAESGKGSSQYEKADSSPFYGEYLDIFDTAEKEIKEMKKDISFDDVEGNMQVVDRMKQCVDAIKELKKRNNK